MDGLATNLALVAAIKEYPCLYDNNLPAYSKKETTDKAWAEVANEIGIPAAECREKWKNLRWGFIRSLRPNADGSVKKKYYLHDQMEFVLPFVKLLPKQGNFVAPPQDSDTDDENILLANEFLEHDTYQDAPNNKRRRNEQMNNSEMHQNESQFYENESLPEPHKKRTKTHEQGPKPSIDTDTRQMFLLSLLPEVNVLTEKQMRMFRRKVFQLIDDIMEDTPNVAKEKPTQELTLTLQTEIIKTEIPD